MEREFLMRIDYDLVVSKEQFNECVIKLKSYLEKMDAAETVNSAADDQDTIARPHDTKLE